MVLQQGQQGRQNEHGGNTRNGHNRGKKDADGLVGNERSGQQRRKANRNDDDIAGNGPGWLLEHVPNGCLPGPFLAEYGAGAFQKMNGKIDRQSQGK